MQSTVTVNMRCLNMESDGVSPYIDEHGRQIVTVEKKRRKAADFCPDDVEAGGRSMVYRNPVQRSSWFRATRCRCHGLLRLAKKMPTEGDFR